MASPPPLTKPIYTISPTPSTIPFEQQIIPTHTFTSPPPSPIHILFIPGGFGTAQHAKSNWSPIIDYLNNFFSDDSRIRNLKGIFTVCTGSILLARSRIRDNTITTPTEGGQLKGILDGVNATTNKRALERAKDEHPNVLWESQARWVHTTLSLPLTTTTTTKQIKLWTTSGVSAGLDGIFALISNEYGPPIADYISQILEYTRTTDPKNDPFAPPESA